MFPIYGADKFDPDLLVAPLGNPRFSQADNLLYLVQKGAHTRGLETPDTPDGPDVLDAGEVVEGLVGEGWRRV